MGMYPSKCEFCGNGFMWHSSTPSSTVCYDCRKPKKSMEKVVKTVKEFHDAFNVDCNTEPCIPSQDTCLLRYKLMREENEEYLEACNAGDLTEIADALGDKLYILAGTILAHGMQDIIVDVFNEIHRSNMSKLGEDGKPIYREDGKVLKGPDYFKPNLKPIVNGTN